ncbi:MAG: methanogenesis marker 6 protein [Candidatus Methanofastidiosa archaeon]|jgi:putative methanogenesis marker protein 6|nr:methanogenesis marker 6 protein [Candidatus Methanofastidiosa archaeon]
MKTRMFVIADTSSLTPQTVINYIVSLGKTLNIKDTCYGIMVEGDEDVVENVTLKIREKFNADIFSKHRAYPIGDERRCRATRGGGARPGYYFLKEEYKLLPMISNVLKEGRFKTLEKKKKKPVDVDLLKKAISEKV